MDDLKKAFESQDYRKVLELTNNKKELVFVIYRLSALIALKRFRMALDLLIENRDELYAHDPLTTLETSFSLRFSLEQFEEAYDDIDIYNNYPYVNQAVEEELRALPKRIRKAERDFLKAQYSEGINLSIEQSEEELLRNLDSIEVKDIADYLPQLRKVVSSLGKDGARTYALMLLVAGEDEKEIRFIKNGSEFIVTPKELERPFSGEAHLRFLNELTAECKDPSVANVALSLYSKALVKAYPEPLLEINKTLDYALAFIDIAREYLHVDNSLPSHIDPEVIERVHKFVDAA